MSATLRAGAREFRRSSDNRWHADGATVGELGDRFGMYNQWHTDGANVAELGDRFGDANTSDQSDRLISLCRETFRAPGKGIMSEHSIVQNTLSQTIWILGEHDTVQATYSGPCWPCALSAILGNRLQC